MAKIVLGTNQFSILVLCGTVGQEAGHFSGFQAFPLTETPTPAILPLVALLSVEHSHRR